MLPKSVQIPLDYDRNGTPQVRGMNASVFKGEYQGREVAVKVMARSRGGLREVVRVSHRRGCQSPCLQADCVEVLLGSAYLENSPPSKCVTTLGSGD